MPVITTKTVFYLAGVPYSSADHDIGDYAKIISTPDFDTQAKAETFLEDVVLNVDNKFFYRVGNNPGHEGVIFHEDFIRIIQETRTLL